MNHNHPKVQHVKALGILLDSKFSGPFGLRFGLDGILGLIPFAGDIITTFMSLYILAQAAALGCSPAVLLRMGGNILLENLVDTIPVAGSLFDFIWKANNKNITLLEEHLKNPKAVTFKSQLILAFICLCLLAFLAASIYFTVFILEKIVEWVSLFAS